MSRTKIVATIGPVSLEPGVLKQFLEAGMDVARLNGAHADHAWHRKAVAALREEAPDVPILLDIPGVKVRVGAIGVDRFPAAGEVLTLACGEVPAADAVPLTRPDVHLHVQPGLLLSFDDSSLQVRVEAVEGQDVRCRVERGGLLGQGKGVHAPGLSMSDFVISPRDVGLLQLAAEQGIDLVGLSYIEDADQVRRVRELLGAGGPRIITKIETRLALDNLEAIIQASDGLMIDRGDLSMETAFDQVAIFQKQILAAANRSACPVIVATQMLHTMIEAPFPTKAEVADITAAVLDGASALMLSGETAVGAYPVASIQVMRQVAEAAGTFQQGLLDHGAAPGASLVPNAVSEAISLLCRRLPVDRIVAVTRSGFAARVLASFLPRQPILAVSDDPVMARGFNLLRGVTGVHSGTRFQKNSTAHIPACLEELWRRGLLRDEDLIVVTAVAYPRSGNRMNMIETHVVSDLRASLGWTARGEA